MITLKCPCCKKKRTSNAERYKYWVTINGIAYEKCAACKAEHKHINTKNCPVHFRTVVPRQQLKAAEIAMDYSNNKP